MKKRNFIFVPFNNFADKKRVYIAPILNLGFQHGSEKI